jgi:hypothetical protein
MSLAQPLPPPVSSNEGEGLRTTALAQAFWVGSCRYYGTTSQGCLKVVMGCLFCNAEPPLPVAGTTEAQTVVQIQSIRKTMVSTGLMAQQAAGCEGFKF